MGVFSDFIRDLAGELDKAIPASPTLDSINERIKALDDESYDVIHSIVNDSLTNGGLTNVVNVSESGILLAISVIVTTAPGTGDLVTRLEIVIDGGTTRTISCWNAATSWDSSGLLQFAQGVLQSGGQLVSHKALIPIGGAKYLTSLKVGHNVTTVDSTAGIITLGVIRGVKL